MSDHKEHISQYTAADIQRYVQGKLSAREMHAMEKAALDDPFLADAIEGMQEAFTSHSENLVTGQLQQLQQQLQTRTATSGKVVAFKPFRYWQAAAAAVVIIVTGVWIYSLVSNKEVAANKSVIAKTEEQLPQQQQAPAPESVSADTSAATGITNQQPATKAIVKPSTPVVSENRHMDDRAARTITVPQPQAYSPLSRETIDTSRSFQNAITADRYDNKEEDMAKQEVLPSAAVPELGKAKDSKSDNNLYNQNRERETELITIKRSDSHAKKAYGAYNNNLSGVVKGQVTDFNRNPIANAYVQINQLNKNNNNFITDKAGFFNIPASDSVVDVKVNVAGYGTQNFTLQNNATVNQLQLQPANASQNDIVITLSGKNKLYTPTINSQLPNNVVFDAEPVFGWMAFEQYLEKNKKIPAGINPTTGKVVVSFEVNKKGTLSGFRIVQSLAKPYDDEAIRLIMQGPSWKLLKGRKARITVMVRF